MIYFHNPRCSKSRTGLELLSEKDVKPEIVLYLDTPPSTEMLDDICKKLAIKPQELVRQADAKKLNICLDGKTDHEILEIMANHPILIERPIGITASHAVIGRPPEALLTLL